MYDEDNNITFSSLEKKLLSHYGVEDSNDPLYAYECMALNAFEDDDKSNLSNAVRQGYKALLSGSPQRLTSDFDRLLRRAMMTLAGDEQNGEQNEETGVHSRSDVLDRAFGVTHHNCGS